MPDFPLKQNRTALRRILCLILLVSSLGGGAPLRAAKQQPVENFDDWKDGARRAEARTGEKWGVLVWDLANDKEVFAWQPDRRLMPASNRKIVTLGMALEILGPDYVFTTQFGLDKRLEPGAAHYHGNVILRSMGDPSLDEPFMEHNDNPEDMLNQWIDGIRKKGIAYIHGDLIVDASAFGPAQRKYPEVWDWRNHGLSFAVIPTAIAFDRNTLTVKVEPGISGEEASLDVSPFSGAARIVNRTTTRRGGESGASINLDPDSGRYIVSGNVRRNGEDEVATRALDDPLDLLAKDIERRIKRSGVSLTGSVRIQLEPSPEGPAPIQTEIGIHRAPPITTLLAVMLQRSDNFIAEQIWHACGAKVAGVGSTENTRRIEQDWYRAIGQSWIEPGWDGSGLSRRDLTTPRELLLVLEYIYSSANRDILFDALAVSGRRGTLRGRNFDARAGRIFGKTGTLEGVSALSGFVLDKSNTPRLAFSIIGNARAETYGRLTRRIDDLVKILIEHLDAGEWPAPSFKPARLAVIPETLASGSSDSGANVPVSTPASGADTDAAADEAETLSPSRPAPIVEGAEAIAPPAQPESDASPLSSTPLSGTPETSAPQAAESMPPPPMPPDIVLPTPEPTAAPATAFESTEPEPTVEPTITPQPLPTPETTPAASAAPANGANASAGSSGDALDGDGQPIAGGAHSAESDAEAAAVPHKVPTRKYKKRM